MNDFFKNPVRYILDKIEEHCEHWENVTYRPYKVPNGKFIVKVRTKFFRGNEYKAALNQWLKVSEKTGLISYVSNPEKSTMFDTEEEAVNFLITTFPECEVINSDED